MSEEDKQRKRDWCDCDVPGCDCDLPCGCDLMFTSLLLVSGTSQRQPVVRSRVTAPARVGATAIRGYQRWLSPRLPTRCRMSPTCSQYGLQAVRRYGLGYGSQLTASRIKRCGRTDTMGTPDPVP